MKIACWSGPRNLSTALMYSFGQRMEVVDEPFYAAYLHATGLDHPMRAETLASQATDCEHVIANIPSNPHYLKLMTHHMLPDFPMDWASEYKHIFLIRHPARVVASYLAKRETPSFEDIGFRQQAELFDRFGGVVIDSHQIRANPEIALRALCRAVGLEFDAKMLNWPKGGHPADGIWAKHWYDSVHGSTGFAGAEAPLPDIQHPLIDTALPIYRQLSARALTI